MSEWNREFREFEDKWLARIAWETGRKSYCPAGILADEERTEREWSKDWLSICSVRSGYTPQPNPIKQEKE